MTALQMPNECNSVGGIMFVRICYRHAHLYLRNSGVGGTLLKQGDMINNSKIQLKCECDSERWSGSGGASTIQQWFGFPRFTSPKSWFLNWVLKHLLNRQWSTYSEPYYCIDLNDLVYWNNVALKPAAAHLPTHLMCAIKQHGSVPEALWSHGSIQGT
jgi:hypothetical protein